MGHEPARLVRRLLRKGRWSASTHLEASDSGPDLMGTVPSSVFDSGIGASAGAGCVRWPVVPAIQSAEVHEAERGITRFFKHHRDDPAADTGDCVSGNGSKALAKDFGTVLRELGWTHDGERWIGPRTATSTSWDFGAKTLPKFTVRHVVEGIVSELQPEEEGLLVEIVTLDAAVPVRRKLVQSDNLIPRCQGHSRSES